MCNAHNHTPGCSCDFRGGHAGVRGGFYSNSSTRGYASCGDFCRPVTCSYCGASIFFVRHNNGSVWFDSLGKPWPKHECYNSYQVTSIADRDEQKGIDSWLLRLNNPLIGVVIDTKWDRAAGAKYFIVKCSDGTEQTLRVYITFSVESSKGEMVIFSRKDGKLIRPYLSLESIIDLKPPPPSPVPESVKREQLAEEAYQRMKLDREGKRQRERDAHHKLHQKR